MDKYKEFDEQILRGEATFDVNHLSARDVSRVSLLRKTPNSYIFTLSFFNEYFKALSEEEQDKRLRHYIKEGFTYLIEMGLIANVIKPKEEYLELTNDENIRLLLSHKDEYETRRTKACENATENFTDVISLKLRLHYFKDFDAKMLRMNVQDFLREEKYELYIYKNDLGYSLESIIQPEIKFDTEWILECDKYIQSLSIRDFFTLKGYSYRGDSMVNKFLISGLTTERNVSDEDIKYIEETYWYMKAFFPLFFQVRECCKMIENKDEDIQVILGDDLTLSYNKVLSYKNKFDKEFYKNVLNMYIEDLNRIINGAPRLKKESVIFRGSKTRYYSTNLGSTFKTVSFT